MNQASGGNYSVWPPVCMRRFPCLPGPGEESLVPRNGSWLPGDNVKQRLGVRSVACPQLTRLLLGSETELKQVLHPPCRGRPSTRTHMAEETELVILPPETSVIGTRGTLLRPGKSKEVLESVISQKLAMYLLALRTAGAILKTSKLRHKREDMTAFKIFGRFEK